MGTGQRGELDYVVISADEQTYIVEWLKSNNYHVTSLAETSLKKIESQKSFFFAAKLAENADPTTPLTPVRFILPDFKTPMYPLVLTGLGVPEGASLELSLWLIFPDDTYYSIFKFLGNLVKFKAKKNFDRRNTSRISWIKIFFQRSKLGKLTKT